MLSPPPMDATTPLHQPSTKWPKSNPPKDVPPPCSLWCVAAKYIGLWGQISSFCVVDTLRCLYSSAFFTPWCNLLFRENKNVSDKSCRQHMCLVPFRGPGHQHLWCSSSLCEVHLWSEHLAVTAGWPFCGSDKIWMPWTPPPHWRAPKAIWAKYSIHIWEVGWMSQTPPPIPTEAHYSIGSDAETRDKGGGGLRTAVASALLLVFPLNTVAPGRVCEGNRNRCS